MKAVEANFLTFLNVKQQFNIPIYQRTYSWLKEECLQLWADVLRAGRDANTHTHFIGSIVYIAPATVTLATGTPQRLVIDGQQRQTTLTLLLAALRDELQTREARDEWAEEVTSEQIQNECLQNPYGAPDKRPKLLLTEKDKATLLRIVNQESLEGLSSEMLARNVADNYGLFRTQISAALDKQVTPDAIWSGIKKLMVVEVSLEQGVDDPQLIFESLNSTGRDLSQADLIRNFVLMRLSADEQNSLYKNQ